jgi:small subunit ribosomal protein S3
MGQKVNPKGFRIGVYRDWDAKWFARRSYGQQLLEDLVIRRFVDKNLKHAEVARVEIEKAGDSIKVIISLWSSRTCYWEKGQDIDVLRKDIAKLTGKNSIEVSVQEVKNADLDATLVAKSIAEQLEKRGSFKKAMKRSTTNTMRAGATGIKICCGGRLNGAEIARKEWMRTGSVPLHTLRADIDYGFAEANTTYGKIGVKVWIGRGEYQFA